jgi:hypothetical protein
MNALANSQEGELRKFLDIGIPAGQPRVRFARYTGQEDEARREAILDRPPDILLTNYVMLELILTRHDERRLVERARGLRFLVLDELHTYRGRQGADVALLMRRALAPLLFDDDDRLAAEAGRRSVVAPAQRSPRAKAKALLKQTDDGAPVQSFQSLLRQLGTIVKDRVRLKSAAAIEFDKITTPTPLQQRALDLLGVSLAL